MLPQQNIDIIVHVRGVEEESRIFILTFLCVKMTLSPIDVGILEICSHFLVLVVGVVDIDKVVKLMGSGAFASVMACEDAKHKKELVSLKVFCVPGLSFILSFLLTILVCHRFITISQVLPSGRNLK